MRFAKGEKSDETGVDMKYTVLLLSAALFVMRTDVANAEWKSEVAMPWKSTNQHLYDLTSQGYRVVGFNYERDHAATTETFFLQKDNDLLRCTLSYIGPSGKTRFFDSCDILSKPKDGK